MSRINLVVKAFILFCLTFNTALAGEIFSDDFESGNLNGGTGTGRWTGSTWASVSAENPKTGNYSLKVRFEAKYPNSFAEQRFDLGGHYPDVWIKYDLFIPSNYVHRTITSGSNSGTNNKGHIALWAGDYDGSGAEGPKLHTQWWAAHWSETQTSQAVTTAIAAIDGKRVLNHNYNSTGEEHGRGDAVTEADKGHWMTIVIHAKYATTANNDGIFEIWKTDWQGNTKKLIDIQDGPWYGTQPNGNPARGFDKGYLLGWAASGFVEETILYIDNVTFSTNSLLGEIDNTAAPKAPIIFSSN